MAYDYIIYIINASHVMILSGIFTSGNGMNKL